MDSLFFILLALGIISAFIGTLAGGGGIITLPAMMLTGIPIGVGIATNKFASGVAALTSVFYLLKGKHLKIKTIFIIVTTAFFGGMCGALVTASLSEQTMNVIALILLSFALLVTVKSKSLVESVKAEAKKENGASLPLIPFFIAVYDGGFGPGSSTFAIINFMDKGSPYMKAVQLTRVLLLGSCTGAFIVYYQTGFVQWHYAIAMAIGSILGSQMGLAALPHVPMKLARSLLLSILFLLIGQVVYKLV